MRQIITLIMALVLQGTAVAELADIKDDMAAQLQRAREMDVDGELAAIPADGR